LVINRLENDDGRYRNAIVLINRGGCYFNHKVVHAQRAGASAVIVVQYPEEQTLFSPDIDDKATTFQPEPVTIPLLMMLHSQASVVLRHGMERSMRKITPRMGLYGNYYGSRGGLDKKNRYKSIQMSRRVTAPFELMVRFQRGSFDLSMGRPGVVGNPRSKGSPIRIKKRLSFDSLYMMTKLTIPIERKKICPICQGKGGVEGGLIQCPHCGHTHAPGRHVVHDHLGVSCSQ
jgi:hypothetical protein